MTVRTPWTRRDRLSLGSNIAWTVAGNAVFAVGQWAMIVVVARLGSPEAVGQLALGLAISAPVFLLADLDLRSAQASDVTATYAFSEYLGLRLVTIPVAVTVIGAIVAVTGLAWETAGVVLLVACARAVESASDGFYGLFQQVERLDLLAASLALRAIVGVGLFAGVFWHSGSLSWSVAALIAGWAAVLGGHDLFAGLSALRTRGHEPHLRDLVPAWRRRRLALLVRVTLPLGLAAGLSSLTVNAPRYQVQLSLGTAELGVFAAVAYAIRAVQVLSSAVRQATIPRLAKVLVDGDRAQFTTLVLQLLALAGALGIAGIAGAALVGEPLLAALYGDTYARGGLLVAVMVAGLVMLVFAVPGVSALVAARRFNSLLRSYAVTALVVVGTGLWLIPTFGLAGAAHAVTLGFLAGIAATARSVRQILAREG